MIKILAQLSVGDFKRLHKKVIFITNDFVAKDSKFHKEPINKYYVKKVTDRVMYMIKKDEEKKLVIIDIRSKTRLISDDSTELSKFYDFLELEGFKDVYIKIVDSNSSEAMEKLIEAFYKKEDIENNKNLEKKESILNDILCLTSKKYV